MAFPLDGLVSYWKLDEPSGIRLDRHGTNHLTPTNNPVGVAGKVGNACDFESTASQYLSHPDPNPLGDEDWTYSFWFKRESFATTMQLLAKDDSIPGGRFYSLEFNTGGGATFYFHRADVVMSAVIAGLANTNWHFVVMWHDAAANTINIQLNAEPVVMIGYASYLPSAAVTDVRIGSRAYSGNENYFDGLIDEVGLWRRVLTPAARTALWNGGAGLPYPEAATGSAVLTLPPATGPVLTLPPAIGAVLSVPPATGAVLSLPVPPVSGPTYQERILADGAIAYWPLDDPSGTTARDLAGTRHGTISGGVTLNQPGVGGGKCMSFVGVSGKIDMSAIPAINAGHSFEAWMFRTNIPDGQTILLCRDGFPPGAFLFGTQNAFAGSHRQISNYASIINTHSDPVFMPNDLWHHYVVTYDGTTASHYLDGVFAASFPLAFVDNSVDAPLSTGGSPQISVDPRSFMAQDIAIYNRALTPAEIQSHYTKRLEGAPFSGLVSTDQLVSLWDFDADFNDKVGTNHLTNNGGVTRVPGKLGNAADFERDSSQYLSTPLSLGDETFTIALWVKCESISGDRVVIYKQDTFQAYIADWGTLYFNVGIDAVGGHIAAGTSFNNTDWHFVVFMHDAALNIQSIQIDNGAVGTNASSVPNSNANPFILGMMPTRLFDGLIDQPLLFKRILSAAERTALFNSGNGLRY